jgi:TonB family protein
MNRLQKKCLFAAAGTHLLVVVVVLCSGFIKSTPKVDETQAIDVIPSIAIDALLNSGVKNYTPPTPTPVVTPPTPTPPTPEPPQPVVTPPKQIEPVTPPDKTEPDLTPVKIPDKSPKRHDISPDFKPVTRTDADDAAAKKAAADAKRKRDATAKLLRDAASNIKNKTSSATEVAMPGDSSASYANYGAIVVSVYHRTWPSLVPENMTSEAAVVSFSVTIASDGSVISSHITQSSGEPNVDRAVQRMLDRVTFIHAFPDDTSDHERTYNIDFNATRTSIQ